jgi:biopolymer transport protein ExbD
MPAKRRREMIVPTASMGDIAFLLTIFFILTSNFAKEAGIKYNPAKAKEVTSLKESRVSVVVNENGQLYLQGKQVQDAKAIEWGVAALIANAKTPEGKMVMLKCDKDVDRHVFEPVLEALSKAGGLIVAIGEKNTGAQAPRK